MRGNGMKVVVGLVLAVAMTSVSAWASDKVLAGVTVTSPTAVVTPNGMAVGTIHVVYTVSASEVTPGGEVGSFNLFLSLY